MARGVRRLWSLYSQNEDIIQIGAYETGSNPDLDRAIELKPAINRFLTQEHDEAYSFEQTVQLLTAVDEESA